MHRKLPTQAELNALFSLDAKTGSLIHKKKFGIAEGSVAGSPMPSGYLRVKANGTLYLAHRLIYAMHYGVDPGEKEVDHINGDKRDNRPDNLRLATRCENRQNVSAYKSNRHNARGVWFDKRRNAFFCSAQANKSREQFGPFETMSAAYEKYQEIAREMFGEFYPEGRV